MNGNDTKEIKTLFKAFLEEHLKEKRGFLQHPIVDLAFKVAVVVIIPWSVWVTNSIYDNVSFRNRGDRFTLQMGYALEKRIEDRFGCDAPDDLAGSDQASSGRMHPDAERDA